MERLSLRLRIFLFFALIAAAILAVLLCAGIYVASAGEDDLVERLALSGLLSAFALVGLVTWVWFKFDDHVARPLERLGGELSAAVHAGAEGPVEDGRARYLGSLVPALSEASRELAAARRDVEERVNEATQEAERQKGRLEAVLRDLEQGVVISTLDHRILLYNRYARTLLESGNGASCGLGRPLTDLFVAQPLRHALERLTRRFANRRHETHRDGLAAPFISATVTGHESVRGRMSLVLDSEHARPIGYVITFDRVTDELAAGIWRDRLLQDVTRDMRRRVAALSMAAEVLLRRSSSTGAVGNGDLDRLRETVGEETRVLGERLDRLDQVAGDLLSGAWPMTEVFSSTLLDCVAARRSEGRGLTFESAGETLWLSCDSASVVELVDRIVNRVAVDTGTRHFRLVMRRRAQGAALDIMHEGPPVPVSRLEAWLDEALDDSLGAMTGHDVLSRHKTEMWPDRDEAGCARVRLPLALAPGRENMAPRQAPPLSPLAERPEFYDFDLFARPAPASMGEAPLRTLSYVVFDTETTGLEPSRGDELVSIAGVRIVNGRILRSEAFDTLVDPGRNIPAASTRVHGITQEMVAGAQSANEVLPLFHRFVGDSVLVAHNAAFDMTFLTRNRKAAGVSFDQPVLDTVLLAGHLFGAGESLTLDALAARFGIVIPQEARHTALGDALATAEVLLKLLGLLEARGVVTLDQAIAVSNRQAGLRRRQKGY
jgi:DNA polymerase-3 subunit epsilon